MQDEQKGARVYQPNSLAKTLNELNIVKNKGFNKAKRLLSSRQYSNVLRNGKTQRNPLFVMVSRPNEVSTGRMGITVSKKVSKRAVDRNRLKRLIRDTFRHSHSKLPERDFVIIARVRAAQADNQTIRESLTEMWAKVISISN